MMQQQHLQRLRSSVVFASHPSFVPRPCVPSLPCVQRVLSAGIRGERIDPTDLLDLRRCGRGLVENQRMDVISKGLKDSARRAGPRAAGWARAFLLLRKRSRVVL